MKKITGMAFAVAMILGSAATGANAQNMASNMMGMMQCSASCNTQYLQCVASANQLASTPAQGLSQIQTNFQGSTQCGRDAIACQASCR